VGRSVDSLQSREEIQHLLEAYRLDATIEDFSLYRLRDSTVSRVR
jgi:hypothetical protein